MKFGLPLSVMAHTACLGAGMFLIGKPQVLDGPDVIPIQIFTISDVSNVRAAQKAPDPQPQPKPQEPVIGAPPPPAEQPKPASPVEPEIIPEVIATDPEPADEPVEETAELTTPDESATRPVDTPTEEPKGPQPLSLAELQNMVAGTKANQQSTDQQMLESERIRIEADQENRAAVGAGSGLTTSYEDAIMRRVRSAWEIPAGAPDLETLIVSVNVELDRDGKVVSAVLDGNSRRLARSNDFYKIASENAVRAVQEAAQFKFLPRTQYEKWRSLKLTFRPQDMPNTIPT